MNQDVIPQEQRANGAPVGRRVDWIDCAKGLTILLTIIGHSVTEGMRGSVLRGLIFSFHMPLFFILSCVTYRYAKTVDELKAKAIKGVRHLLLPAVFVFAVSVAWQCCQNSSLVLSRDFWMDTLYTLIFASGVKTSYAGFAVAAIGVPWFFFALLTGRTIFDYLHLQSENDSRLFVESLVIGVLGIMLGKLYWLPFSLDIALAILPLFYYGYFLKGKDFTAHPVRAMLIWGLVWLLSLGITFPDYRNWTYLELACRRYPLFPIGYVAAIAGTMFVCKFSVLACRLRGLVKPVLFLGKNSLYLLCVHIVDDIWSFLWEVEGRQFHTAVRRVLADLAVFAVVMIIKLLADKVRMRVRATADG